MDAQRALPALFVVVLWVAPAALGQTTYYVNGTCGDDAWAGTDPNCVAPNGPFATIQAGIDAATHGDTVIVADGVYTGPGNWELDFLGKAITLKSENGPNNCRIHAHDDVNDTPHPIAKFVSGEDPNTVVEGINFSNGRFDQPVAGFQAGGLTCVGTSPTIRNCKFTGNARTFEPTSRAGAVFCSSANPLLEDCVFQQNLGSSNSVMYCEDSSPLVQDCVLDYNGSDTTGQVIGIGGASSAPLFTRCEFLPQNLKNQGFVARINNGGTATFDECVFDSDFHRQLIAEDGTTVTLRDSLFQRAAAFESAVRIDDGLVSGCVFREAYNESNNGGALGITGTATVVDCLITANISGSGAGLWVHSGANVTIERSGIVGNVTMGNGGGLVVAHLSTCVLRNSVVADNIADFFGISGTGGGIWVNNTADFTIENSTIANNFAFGSGGGIFGPVTIRNSIVWGNVPDQHDHFSILVTYSDYQGGITGTGNINVDPLFLVAEDGDYHISTASPCVNAGDPNYVADPNELDYEGDPRVIGGSVDMGADETDPNSPCIALSPQSFTFMADQGGPNPATQQIDISNACGATLNWTISSDCSWLTPSPTSGSALPAEADAVTLSVDTTGVPGGVQTCQLTIEDPSAVNSPRTIVVTLRLSGTLRVPSEYATIQEAVDAAFDGNEILIADGTYTGPANRNILISGKYIEIRSENGPAGCRINCNGNGGAFNVIDVTSGETVIEGVTIQNGTSSSGRGGGIFCDGAPLTIRNCVVTNCSAPNGGGGIHAANAEVHILDSEIINNSSTHGAGGLNIAQGTGSSIEDCRIAGNIGKGAGGAFVRDAIVARCIIENNMSTDAGPGGLEQREANVEDTVIQNNTCAMGSTGAGGYHCNVGVAGNAIRGCTIRGNQGGRTGGMTLTGPVVVERTEITENTGTDSGGGVRIDEGDPSFIACEISKNTAPDGGGVYVNSSGSNVSFLGCTIADNSDHGIFLDGLVTVDNAIVWGNGPAAFENDTALNLQVNWSDVQGGVAGTGNMDTNPLFVSALAGNYHLRSTSPCIDGGDPSYVTDPNDLDIDGDPRVVNGRIDMGADEWNAVLMADFDGDGDVDLADFATFTQCFGGSFNPPAATCPAGVDADLDNDGDVDLADFALFTQQFTGAS